MWKLKNKKNSKSKSIDISRDWEGSQVEGEATVEKGKWVDAICACCMPAWKCQ
jgi:hypothetical protein